MKLNLDIATFLQQYWQKQPKVFRNAFTDFTDPLDEHDLAGLSELEEVDSRIVAIDHDQWQVFHGPFDNFDEVCRGEWSLLVQGVDQYVDEAHALLNHFNFIPNWRLDDLMVSFSIKNGGVGPHLDQYDVFIIQGKGSRRWQVGSCNNPLSPYQALRPHADLSQIEPFSPIIDEVLQPGDVIYIPPGFPHNGVALEPCLNYSVGFRAPNQMQLWENLLQHYHDNDIATERYHDPQLQARKHSAEITANELKSLQSMMQHAINNMASNPELITWFLAWNTLNGVEAPVTTVEELVSEEEVNAIWHELAKCEQLNKCPGTRTLFYAGDAFLYFAVNGHVGKVATTDSNSNEVSVIQQWLSALSTPPEQLLAAIQSAEVKQFIALCIVEEWYEYY